MRQCRRCDHPVPELAAGSVREQTDDLVLAGVLTACEAHGMGCTERAMATASGVQVVVCGALSCAPGGNVPALSMSTCRGSFISRNCRAAATTDARELRSHCITRTSAEGCCERMEERSAAADDVSRTNITTAHHQHHHITNITTAHNVGASRSSHAVHMLSLLLEIQCLP